VSCIVSIIIVELPEIIENWRCGVASQSNIVRHKDPEKLDAVSRC
jgi:hypothetical protein